MKGVVYINGRAVSSFEYEHPREDGKTVPTPKKCCCSHWPCRCNDVSIAITDGDGRTWFASGHLDKIS